MSQARILFLGLVAFGLYFLNEWAGADAQSTVSIICAYLIGIGVTKTGE